MTKSTVVLAAAMFTLSFAARSAIAGNQQSRRISMTVTEAGFTPKKVQEARRWFCPSRAGPSGRAPPRS